MSEDQKGLEIIIEQLKSYSFDTQELLFDGIHASSLILAKRSAAWSNIDLFTPINVENKIFEKYSDIYVFSTKFSLTERNIYKSLGFDFDQIESICKLYVTYMHDFKMHQFDYFYIKAAFREALNSNYESFGGIAIDGNYYSKEFSGCLTLRDARIYIQLFLDYQDGVITPMAKLTFPLSEEGYFSIILGTDKLYESAQHIIKEGVMSEFKAYLIVQYPDECYDAIEFNEETLRQYITIIGMDKI